MNGLPAESKVIIECYMCAAKQALGAGFQCLQCLALEWNLFVEYGED